MKEVIDTGTGTLKLLDLVGLVAVDALLASLPGSLLYSAITCT